MHFSFPPLVLTIMALGQTLARPSRHGHVYGKKIMDWEDVGAIVERGGLPTENANTSLAAGQVADNALSSTAVSRLAALGCQPGINSFSNNGGVWIGSDGAYTNNFVNAASDDLILVIWGPAASWVNVNQPLVTIDLPAGAGQTISFAMHSIGAWSAIYPDTKTYNGMIVNTWGEYTMSPMGVVDVSREVNMSGHPMSIVGPQCTSDMNRCVFVCASGNFCTNDYQLLNCAAGSQPGAKYGTDGDSPSGGCGGLGNGAALTTTFS